MDSEGKPKRFDRILDWLMPIMMFVVGIVYFVNNGLVLFLITFIAVGILSLPPVKERLRHYPKPVSPICWAVVTILMLVLLIQVCVK
ncbi:MAG: hypothetical protein P9X24_17790 [Candidatus Hatepunaea meridiana]|nr:hypothetical protein [Candidatus Hatepunaea meridiana]